MNFNKDRLIRGDIIFILSMQHIVCSYSIENLSLKCYQCELCNSLDEVF